MCLLINTIHTYLRALTGRGIGVVRTIPARNARFCATLPCKARR